MAFPCPVARFATHLLQKLNLAHHHPPIYRLTHIIDGEQGDLHCSKRLHLHPGLATGLDGGVTGYADGLGEGGKFNIDLAQG